MKGSKEFDELIDEVLSTLKRGGYIVHIVSYPEDRRSIDIVARRDKEVLLIKVALDADKITNLEIEDLRKSAVAYSASSIIISRSYKGRNIEDDVVYVKGNVNVISPELFKNYIVKNEKPLIYNIKGVYVLRLDPHKFCERRMEMNLSRGELAEALGLTRKALYLYEKGSSMVSLNTALQLAEYFGEDIFKEIDPLKDRVSEEDATVIKSDRERLDRELTNILSRYNYVGILFKRTPVDIALKGDRTFSIVKQDETMESHRKLDEAEEMANLTESLLIVLKEKDGLKELEKLIKKIA
ncbi:MAG: helix-turn-helix domain-containing protein [Thermosphaera sp.]